MRQPTEAKRGDEYEQMLGLETIADTVHQAIIQGDEKTVLSIAQILYIEGPPLDSEEHATTVKNLAAILDLKNQIRNGEADTELVALDAGNVRRIAQNLYEWPADYQTETVPGAANETRDLLCFEDPDLPSLRVYVVEREERTGKVVELDAWAVYEPITQIGEAVEKFRDQQLLNQ